MLKGTTKKTSKPSSSSKNQKKVFIPSNLRSWFESMDIWRIIEHHQVVSGKEYYYSYLRTRIPFNIVDSLWPRFTRHQWNLSWSTIIARAHQNCNSRNNLEWKIASYTILENNSLQKDELLNRWKCRTLVWN